MRVEVLECFLAGQHIGRFERRYRSRVDFVYDSDAEHRLSLSLPIDRPHTPRAARNFLANLLPETVGAKQTMQEHSGATSADDFELLAYVGGDVAGAVQLMPEGQSPGEWMRPPLVARHASIASRIRTVKASENPDSGFDSGEWPLRFSLAGVQAKFALAEIDGEWFWSDAGTPSTHILKPEARAHRGLEHIESAAMRLARACGIPAAEGTQASFADQTSYLTKRFDRHTHDDGTVSRRHAEDLVQAYGEEVAFKYHLGAEETVELLRQHGGDTPAYQFIRQLAFNTGIKNADAHGKNYSLFHHPGGAFELSPMYDVVPMGFFPMFAQHLSMPIGNEEQLSRLACEHWIQLATETGLDADRVRAEVRGVSAEILEHVDAVFGELDVRHRESALAEIKRYNERILSGGVA